MGAGRGAAPPGPPDGSPRSDDHLLLPVGLDIALPAVDRGHRRKHVHARRQALFHERAPQGDGVGIRGDRRQDDDRLDSTGGAHDFACTFLASALFTTCTSAETAVQRPRRSRRHGRLGNTLVLEIETRYFVTTLSECWEKSFFDDRIARGHATKAAPPRGPVRARLYRVRARD